MAETRVFMPVNRLANAVKSGKGLGANELVMDAEIRVAGLSRSIRAFVETELKALLVYRVVNDETLLRELPLIDSRCVRIAEVAGAAGLHSVGAITGGIVAMIDAYRTAKLWRPEALRLHLDSLAAVATAGENDAVVSHLRAMRESMGVTD